MHTLFFILNISLPLKLQGKNKQAITVKTNTGSITITTATVGVAAILVGLPQSFLFFPCVSKYDYLPPQHWSIMLNIVHIGSNSSGSA